MRRVRCSLPGVQKAELMRIWLGNENEILWPAAVLTGLTGL